MLLTLDLDELAEVLSISAVKLDYQTRTDVQVSKDD